MHSSQTRLHLCHSLPFNYILPGILIDYNNVLSDDREALLDTTPFKWVTKMTEERKVSSVLLWELVRRWDEGSRAFKVRGTLIPFTPLDVCMAVGLPAIGDPVVGADGGQCHTLSIFEGVDLTFENILARMPAVHHNVGDFCRACILLAFGVFYFARTGKLVSSDFAWLLDDLDASRSFNWASTVHELLVDSLSRAHTVSRDRSNSSEIHLCGCAPILQVCIFVWAMDHLSIEETPTTPPDHPFPRFLNWPIVTLRKKRMKEAFMNTRVTIAVTPTDAEIQHVVVREALQGGQQQRYVHIEEYHKVLATLREHEDKIREQKERILALEADVAILKEGPRLPRSHGRPVHEYGGCSTLGGQHVSPVHDTPVADMYADVGGVSSSHGGLEMPVSPRTEGDDVNVDDLEVSGGVADESQDEAQTGGHNAEGALAGGSNIATRVKGDHRMRKQSSRLDPPYTRSYTRKNKKTAEE